MLESGTFDDSSLEQLPLELSGPAAPGFDNFIAGDNVEALEQVRALAAGTLAESVLFLWGEQGSGRSHLLHAAKRVNPGLVVVDDVQSLDPSAQQALFNAINAARDGRGGAVLASGDAPPAQLRLREDLTTRLAWGLVYQLRSLSDTQKADHLKAEAMRRGMRLNDDVLRYLLTHLPRDLGSLNRVLDTLDRYSLSRQRAITLPLVRKALSLVQAPDR